MSIHHRSGRPNYGCTSSLAIKGGHERNSSGACGLCGDGPIRQPVEAAMTDDPINELVDVIDLPPLPKLPEPFGAVEMADGSEALVYSADQLRQVQREAYEAGAKVGRAYQYKVGQKIIERRAQQSTTQRPKEKS